MDDTELIYCDGCTETTFEVQGRGPAGITPFGRCTRCGYTVTADDAEVGDMGAQIEDPHT